MTNLDYTKARIGELVECSTDADLLDLVLKLLLHES